MLVAIANSCHDLIFVEILTKTIICLELQLMGPYFMYALFSISKSRLEPKCFIPKRAFLLDLQGNHSLTTKHVRMEQIPNKPFTVWLSISINCLFEPGYVWCLSAPGVVIHRPNPKGQFSPLSLESCYL